jgi:hypothetical protein
MSFRLHSDIRLDMDVDLAVRLGECILKSGTVDKEIRALGHRLVSIEEKIDEQPRWIPKPARRPEAHVENGDFAEGIC